MHTSTRAVRGTLLVVICIIAIAGYRGISRVVAASITRAPVHTEKDTLRSRIANQALLEYTRWHPADTVLRERDTAAIKILKQYWQLGGIPVTENNLKDGSWQYHHPWSAVFISWVMLEAGAGNNFPYSNNHAKYIVWARENAVTKADTVFTAYDLRDQSAAWPAPGDLICMNRRSNRYTMHSLNSRCISHCDIVVELNREQKYIITIGGNVGQTVNKRIVWLDDNGFIDTTRNWQVPDVAEKNPEGPQTEIFGVIRVNPNYTL